MAKKPILNSSDRKKAAAAIDGALKGTGFLGKRFKAGGRIRERIAERAYAKYLAEGGKAGDFKSFLDWLIKNLPAIIALLKELFA